MFREFLGTCSDTLQARPCLKDIALVWAAQQICKGTTQSLHFPQSSRSCLDILDITSWFDVAWLSLSLSSIPSWQPWWYLDCRSSTTLSRPSSSSLAFMAMACSFEPATWTKAWPGQCRWDTSFLLSLMWNWLKVVICCNYILHIDDMVRYHGFYPSELWWRSQHLIAYCGLRWTRVIRCRSLFSGKDYRPLKKVVTKQVVRDAVGMVRETLSCRSCLMVDDRNAVNPLGQQRSLALLHMRSTCGSWANKIK